MQPRVKKIETLISTFILASYMCLSFSTVKANEVKRIRVIIEVEGKSTLDIAKDNNMSRASAIDFVDKVKKGQKSIIDDINKIGGKVRYTFQNVINGVSADINASDIEKIKKIIGVKNVSIVNTYHPLLNTSLDIVNAKTVSDKFNIKGEGTAISIIDTGIDYNHKDMKINDLSKIKFKKEDIKSGPGKWFSHKVPYGYNFSDGNYDIVDKNSSMHGMHVAGIVAANGNENEVQQNKAVRGVAPEAQLFAMKVFSNKPENKIAYSDDIAAAIEDSVKHGADVINMSLGSDAGFVDENDPEQKAIKSAVDAGVIVVVAGGNASYSTEPDYPYMEDVDTGNISSPGLCKDALQVASINNVKMICKAFDYISNGESGKVPYYISEVDPFGKLNGQFEILDCGYGKKEDFEKKNIEGKIAFVKKGHVDYINKKLNAQNAGASGIIVYNSEEDDSYINMPIDPKIKIPALFINNSDGEKIKNLINKNLKISFKNNEVELSDSDKRMSGFSSWGCPQDLSFKPEITAPGGNVYSTINNNKYETKSGTSMASPHVAGLMALMTQQLNLNKDINKDRNFVALTKNLFINTAEPIMDKKNQGFPYLTRQQGAGLIQIDKAIKSKVIVTDENENSVIALKEVGNNTNFKLKLKNLSDKDISFKVLDKFGVLTNQIYYSDNYKKNCLRMIADKVNGAKLLFNKTEIIVPANGETSIDVNLFIPETTMPDIFVEGFITLESQDKEQPSLGIPYMGFYGEWDNPRIFDAPVWEKNSFYGLETLRDLKGNELGIFYNKQKQVEETVTKCISISPNNDKILDEAIPYISFLRNAKEFKIQVLDKDRNVVRNIAYEKNITKNNGINMYPQFSKNWKWDGEIYNSTLGKMEIAKEGQYYIRLSGRIDFAKSDFQNLDIPVKVDITPPKMNIQYDKIQNNKYLLKFNGQDNVGICGYYVYYDNDNEYKYEFSKDEDSGEIVVPDDIKKVTIQAKDFAGNSISQDIINKNIIEFKESIPKIIKDEHLIINYNISDLVKYVDITLDHKYKFNNGKNSSYKLTNLKAGNHEVKFEAYDNNGAKIACELINFTVDTKSSETDVGNKEDSIINVNNINEGQTILGKSIDICGSINVLNKNVILKVNNKDVSVNDEGNFNVHLDFDGYGYKKIELEAQIEGDKIYTKEINIDFSPIKFETKKYFIKENNINIPYTFDDNDNINYVRVTVDEKRSIVKDKEQKFVAIDKLFEGKHKLNFEICDKNDSVIGSREVAVNVDNIRPSILELKNEDGINLTNQCVVKNKITNISGELSEEVEYLKINNEEIKVTNNNENYIFNKQLVLNEGTNLLSFEIKDRAGNIAKYGNKIICDSIPPILKVQPNKDKILVSAETEYTIKISAEDNGLGYSLYVNNNLIDKVQNELGKNNSKEFEYKVHIPQNKTILKIKLVDEAGNISEKTMEICKQDVSLKDDLILTRIGNESFKKGQDAKIKIAVKNNSTIEKQGDIIVVLYNTDTKKMINYNYVNRNIKAGENEIIETGFNIPKQGEYEIKAFVWNNWNEMKSISNSQVIILD